ncbi:hypothetical protein EVA_21832, partial [gut metagenome]
LFYLRVIRWSVHFLYIDGKRVPDIKGWDSLSDGRSMETFPGRDPAV